MTERHYFDNAASSLLNEACLEAERAFDAQPWAGANPSSLHDAGRHAFRALEDARARLARSLGAQRPSEVTFMSGGTEANNTAVCGIAHAVLASSAGRRHRVLVSAIEHESVLRLKGRLALLGIDLDVIPVTAAGVVDLAALGRMLGDDVSLVSVMTVNNEIGSIQPVAEVARMAHAAGALMHTDAVQGFGKTRVDVRELGVDAASVTAHKIGGPIGVGALYLKAHTPIEPLMIGGGQEAGLRSGTTDVRGAVTFAAVAADAVGNLQARSERMREVARVIIDGLAGGDDPVARLPVARNDEEAFIAGTVCLVVPGHDSQSLVLALDNAGYEVAGGSACSSGSLDPSHVLSAVGVPRDLALCELRVSFDSRVTAEEAGGLVAKVREVCGR